MRGVRLDVTGQTFGALTALEPTPRRVHGRVAWRFLCICGAVVERAACDVSSSSRRGASPSCGCIDAGVASPNFIDLSGARFGKLTVIRAEDNIGQGLRWRCECDCGNFSIARTKDLRAGTTTSCGCARTRRGPTGSGPLHRAPTISRGDVFGLLTVQGEACRDNGSRHYLCLCSCGSQTIVRSGLLRTGQTRSCGCLRRLSGARRKDIRDREFETASTTAAALKASPEFRFRLNAEMRSGGLLSCEAA